jgi:16S rRNA (guanine527-N7)-methyltransferase
VTEVEPLRPQVDPATLRRVLTQAHAFGFFGPGDLSPAIEHAHGFLRVAVSAVAYPTAWIDLGSGGGLPGLVGIARFPEASWALLDAQEKRVVFLRSAIIEFSHEVDLHCGTTVLHGRAEQIARLTGQTESVDVVTARGFAPPPVTAECAARFLRVGGVLVVSEPPGGNGVRWAGLAATDLGLELEGVVTDGPSGARFSIIRKTVETPDRFPRAGAALTKRPLFMEAKEAEGG